MDIRPLDHLTAFGDPDAPALVSGQEELSYGELERDVGRIAARLLALRLAKGDRIATWMPKTRLACQMPLAAARAGLVHVPINPVLKAPQAAHILADSGAGLLIANQGRLGGLESHVPTIALEDWHDGEEHLPPSSHDTDELAALLYTSGSTGKPKGVMLSHANLWLGAVAVADYLGMDATERTLALLPLAFDYGQNQLLSTWKAGGCVIAFDYLLANDVKKAVRRHDVTLLAGVPPLWHQLVRLDWSDGEGASLRTLTNSGGHVPEPLFRQLRQLFPNAAIHLMYGLTEAFRSSSLDPELADTHPDSVGTAIPFAELLVVREDGSEAAPGEEGELVHAGPLVAKGYWRDEQKTAERFRPAPSHSRHGGIAAWSGDRMVRGQDGLLRFRGRDNAMIKVSGNRLSPDEIEEAALASGQAVEAAAMGIPDEELGEAVILHCVGSGDEQALRRWFKVNTPAYMMPKTIVWHDRLPTGATGKVDRARLREMAR
ncbi:AMP-binding protein [Sphingomicrobium lutaoense]|uniref:Acyl-CoA synthetase (AMP-forming)/AMP-acid ligase II n=1 Tax=Sphingomicrobium lutaoense TaxID=515949 RepID=A0A839Z1B2_9SPHN|nr:AMP-binding protein [Sphingomicrobium lutaoense]MBB3763847.1 acyl-CoA synthetase (AMP-forming)/AMP-acid ligase II [Sphingomicrobium lutaoense]